MPHRPEHGEDAWGRPLARPKTLDGSERLEAMPAGGEDEHYGGRCGICGRARAAYPECPICDIQWELEDAA